ncbi:hypothetical protein KDL44_09355, partial [bacterium]|nr:hypothetical protein [bacterium]
MAGAGHGLRGLSLTSQPLVGMQPPMVTPRMAEFSLPGLRLELPLERISPDRERDEQALAALLDRQQAELGAQAPLGWRRLPAKSLEDAGIAAQAARLAEGANELLLIGMGGSINGARCVYRALELDSRLLRAVEFMDNPDPASVVSLLEGIDPEHCSVLAVSRSGTTLETVSMLAAALQFLEAGNANAPGVAVCCLENDNPLARLADERNWQRIPFTADTGGRFSMFSASGLLPLAFAGLDIQALCRAGAETAEQLESTRCSDNPAWLLSGMLLGDGCANCVLYVYADLLLGFGDWWRQLIAESTGRTLADGSRVGINPVLARGASDQHSLNQLFMDGPLNCSYVFLSCRESPFDIGIKRGTELLPEGQRHMAGRSLGELLEASRRGTLATLRDRGMPTAELVLERLDETALGSLLQLWMHTTACLGI